MIHLRIYRPIVADSLRNNLIRALRSKPPIDENVSSPSSTSADNAIEENKASAEKQTGIENITNKINLILKGMADDSAKPKEKKQKLPVDDYDLNAMKKIRKAKKGVTPEKAIMDAASSIAQSLGDDKEVENELIAKALEFQTPKITNLNWSNLIKGMQIDNTKQTDDYIEISSRSQQIKSAMAQKGRYSPRTFTERTGKAPGTFSLKVQNVNVFDGKSLGIFEKKEINEATQTQLSMWNKLEEYDKEIAVSHPPANYFEKMIKWTNEGKIWKFPLDNEQDLDERFVHFSEHVFLERHLEGWCPDKGPIRHFMELVCVGLSKNPYMPVKDKKKSVLWFRDYFESKRELLEQVGVYGDVKMQISNKQA